MVRKFTGGRNLDPRLLVNIFGAQTMKITGTKRPNLNVNGTRCGITISAGPWTPQVDPALIKIRPKSGRFPAAVVEALEVENNSDGREDYFEDDSIRLLPGHPLYSAAKALS